MGGCHFCCCPILVTPAVQSKVCSKQDGSNLSAATASFVFTSSYVIRLMECILPGNIADHFSRWAQPLHSYWMKTLSHTGDNNQRDHVIFYTLSLFFGSSIKKKKSCQVKHNCQLQIARNKSEEDMKPFHSL